MSDDIEQGDQPEVAVVMVGERDARFVLGRGPIIESDIEAGLDTDEIGPTYLAPEEKGLWIWEGSPGWARDRTAEGIDEGGAPIYDGCGTWRRPTPEETSRIARGDFTPFGEPRLIFDTESSESNLFAGLTPHTEKS